MQSIVDFLYMVDDMLWGTPMVVIVLGTGIFLSLRFGFSYQRKLKFNIKNTFGNMTAAGEVVGTGSSFRAAARYPASARLVRGLRIRSARGISAALQRQS
ncbi:putative sodium/alanine symporter [Firmicutes bacterium CAG:102]|nr:putative sodium/alanine symporter [Firmicutes bacterium CAG:102]